MIADQTLVEVFLEPIRKCAKYRPAFGLGRTSGLKVQEFRELYGQDAFYSWLGLDTPSVYAAHKAAGGLTSVYRQIGVGSERLFRALAADCLDVSDQQLRWSYTYDKGRGKAAVHTLDVRIELGDLQPPKRTDVQTWLTDAQKFVSSGSTAGPAIHGAAFEVRQGYKSADSKRQNADLRFGINAYRDGLLPVFAIFSAQVSGPVLRRYRADGMLVLTGVLDGDACTSTFTFFREVVGYDLPGFFERNSTAIRAEIGKVVDALLHA